MPIRQFRPIRDCAENEYCSKAYKIVKYAHDSSDALYDAFTTLKGGRPGAATDEEQDVLRAMLVSAGAGLDGTIKQLFRDCLTLLHLYNQNVREGLVRFVERELNKGTAQSEINSKFLANALVEPLPVRYLGERYVYDLTGSSLQSADQLFSASAALGIDARREAHLDKDRLDRIFKVRNKIVHELDIDFDGARRNRVQRRVAQMEQDTNHLLQTAQNFVEMAFDKVQDAQ